MYNPKRSYSCSMQWGGKGMYIRTAVETEAEAEAPARSVEPFR